MNPENGTKLVSEVDGVLIYETASGIQSECYYAPTEPMRLKIEQLEVTLNSRGSSNHTKSKYPIEFELSLYGKVTLPGHQTLSIIGEPDTKSNEILI